MYTYVYICGYIDRCTYISIFREVNAALGYDETGSTDQASLAYRKGIELMQKALGLDLSSVTSEEVLADVRNKHGKMQATLEYAKSRVRELTPVNTATGTWYTRLIPKLWAMSCFKVTGY